MLVGKRCAGTLWIVGGLAVGAGAVMAVDYEAVHQFVRPGSQPLAAVTAGSDGNFYGSTVAGGAHDAGTLFRVSPAGEMVTLAAFDGSNGAAPEAALVSGPDGALYGTTTAGGAGGFGTVFRLALDGAFATVVSFTGTAGTARGAVPQGLVLHPDGNFYGITAAGGTAGQGTVFKMTPAGAVTTLAEFTGTTGAVKGSEPAGALVASGSNLYGVTKRGGAADLGVVYRISTGGSWALLAEFTGNSGSRPGANPAGPLFLHSDGSFYGTTEFGGTAGFGTAFKITSGGTFTSLRSFVDATGSQPAGALVQGADGALYGTTSAGGTDAWGTLYRLTTAGAHSVLADFSGASGSTPGASARGGLSLQGDGTLIGTTSAGGPGEMGVVFTAATGGAVTTLATLSTPLGWTPSGSPVDDGNGGFLLPMASGGAGGAGTLIQTTGSGEPTVVSAFGDALGDTPAGGVLQAGGDFFGVTAAGGGFGRGTAFRFSPSTGTTTTIATFQTSAGSLAEGPLIVGSDGAFYGVSREGGTSGRGTVFRLTGAGARSRVVSFTGGSGASRGNRPRGPLALAGVYFFGLTEAGGSADAGTIFRVTPAGIHWVLADFSASGPRAPRGGLIAADDGKLYGTTSLGGANELGTLIRVDPATTTWEVLADFSASTGGTPVGPLVAGPDGEFYGLTASAGEGGLGTVFRWSAADGLTALVSFTGESGAAPGAGQFDPGDGEIVTGGLALAADGSLWGATPAGGSGGGGVFFHLSINSPLAEWKLSELGDANAADQADPDADGLATLAEYALLRRPGNSDTGNAAAAAAPKAYPDGARLAVVVPRDSSRNDVNVFVEAGSSLAGPWEILASSTQGGVFTGPGYVSGDSPGPGVHLVEIRDSVTISSTPARFLRLRVTR